MKMPTLHNRAVLAYVSISCWSARKLDRKASSKLTKDEQATDDAARVNKYLLANADDQLKEIQSIANKTRRYLEDNSLPWDNAGNRLLSNEQALKVIIEVSQLEKEFSDKVDEFVRDYPLLRAQALQALGNLGDHEDYPQPDVIRQKFSVRVSFTPIPEGFSDFRTGMTDTQAQLLQQHYESSVRSQTNRALMAAWLRLRDDVAKMVDRLEVVPGEKRKIFRDSMVENLQATTALLATLNVFGDDDLDKVRRDVEQLLAGYSPTDLRENDALARSVHADATAIFNRINSLLGDS